MFMITINNDEFKISLQYKKVHKLKECDEFKNCSRTQ